MIRAGAWSVTLEDHADLAHVTPIADLVAHDAVGTNCVCGPFIRLVPNPNGPNGWVVVHQALDGRP